MLPEDWQVRLVDMVRGAAPLDGAWFAGGPALSPLDQIGVYREQFQLRLTEALSAELAGLRGLLGEALDPLLNAYLLDHPPRSWSLDQTADAFPGWLAARGAPAEQVEMATLDQVVSSLFLAADATPVTAAELRADLRLRLTPSSRRLRLSRDVHIHRSATLNLLPARPTVAGDWRLLLYRTPTGPRHWELDRPTDTALAAFERGATVAEAVEATLTEAPESAARLGELFREIATRRALCVAPVDTP